MKRKKTEFFSSWKWILSLLSVALFLFGWYFYGLHSRVPTPVEAVSMLIEMFERKRVGSASLMVHILSSMKRITLGFLFSCIVGILLGVLMGWFKMFRAIFQPLFELIRPVPGLAWIPLFILWFGIGDKTSIIMIVFGAFVPICLNTYHGMTHVDPMLVKAGKNLGANSAQMLLNVALPDSIPAIIAGMRTSLGSCWMAVVASEMIVARSGLGYVILSAMDSMNYKMVMATMILIALGCAIYNYLFTILERVLCPWQFLKQK
jgi:taurine transport system permease protein